MERINIYIKAGDSEREELWDKEEKEEEMRWGSEIYKER